MLIPSLDKIFTKKLTIYQLGNPALREIAQPIANVHDREIQQLIDEMLFTLKESKG
ncbi:MAG: peptide deformylase, partial [Pseudanabaena sp.]